MNIRRSLTKKERSDMLEKQGGKCAWPECESTGPFIAEHTLPVGLGNEEKPDCLLCLYHAGKKTKEDMKRISKANRQRRSHETGRGKARRGKPMESGKRKWPKRTFRNRASKQPKESNSE